MSSSIENQQFGPRHVSINIDMPSFSQSFCLPGQVLNEGVDDQLDPSSYNTASSERREKENSLIKRDSFDSCSSEFIGSSMAKSSADGLRLPVLPDSLSSSPRLLGRIHIYQLSESDQEHILSFLSSRVDMLQLIKVSKLFRALIYPQLYYRFIKKRISFCNEYIRKYNLLTTSLDEIEEIYKNQREENSALYDQHLKRRGISKTFFSELNVCQNDLQNISKILEAARSVNCCTIEINYPNAILRAFKEFQQVFEFHYDVSLKIFREYCSQIDRDYRFIQGKLKARQLKIKRCKKRVALSTLTVVAVGITIFMFLIGFSVISPPSRR